MWWELRGEMNVDEVFKSWQEEVSRSDHLSRITDQCGSVGESEDRLALANI